MFDHSTCINLEKNIIHAFIEEYWEFICEKIKASDLFDETDKARIMGNQYFIKDFLIQNQAYIQFRLFK